MATFNATAIKHPSSSTNNIVLNSDGTIAATSTSAGETDTPACVTAQSSSDTETTNSAVEIVSVTIDPVKSTSKILITAGGPFTGGEESEGGTNCEVQLQRNGNNIATKTIGFVESGGFYIAHLDTTPHSGNQVTYRINLLRGAGAEFATTIYANQGCSICALEIF